MLAAAAFAAGESDAVRVRTAVSLSQQNRENLVRSVQRIVQFPRQADEMPCARSVLLRTAKGDGDFIFALQVGVGAAGVLVLRKQTANFFKRRDCFVAALGLFMRVANLKHGCGGSVFVATCNLVVKRDRFIGLFELSVA